MSESHQEEKGFSVLEIRGLTKRYSRMPVLHEVNFFVRPGEILGYLGPNGAGKSTTVKILVGLLQPSEGEVLYNGRNVHDHLLDYKSRLGYVPEEPLLYPFLTGREYLQLVGRLRALPEKLLNKKIDDLLQLLSLRPHRHSRISSYSKGVIPLFAGLLPIYLIWWDWQTVLLHVSYGLVLALFLIECLLFKLNKIPFTCSYLPGKANLKLLWWVYLFLFTTYAYGMTGVEQWLLRRPTRFVFFYLAAGTVIAAMIRRRRNRSTASHFIYDETPGPLVSPLDLSP
jgi:hypothetical protein